MTLTRELADSSSPIRLFFAERLPETRGMARSYRKALLGSTTMRPDPRAGEPPWSSIGHAISALIQWQLDPVPAESIAGLSCDRILWHNDNQEVFRGYEDAVRAGPDVLDLEQAAKVAWIAGLLDRVHRSAVTEDPLLSPIEKAQDWPSLLDLLPTEWTADVAAMGGACEDIVNAHCTSGVVVDPIFSGSASVGGADGDYITEGGLLVDVKATKEPKLRAAGFRQLISYALLDWDNQYGIESVGILAVRQAQLVTWPLDEALSMMARSDVRAAHLRPALREHLT